jgi:two-component system sensor histidine kinase AlgZ
VTVTPSPAAPTVRPADAAFDACHVGVVLRVVLAVQGGVAVAVGLGSPDATTWLLGWSSASLAALPAVLLGLVVACASGRRLARLPGAATWLAAAGIGAGAAAAGLALRAWALALAVPGVAWAAAMAAGAGVGAGVSGWLRLRAAAQGPAAAAARLAQLQASIRPHFLFNTLNSAIALVRLDPARAEGVLEDLAELFRTTLAADRDPGATVTLDDEITLARRYLDIEAVRFGDRLRLSWELDPAAGRARVPLLLLQPLVENAVRHGVEPSETGGLVRVRTRVERGAVHLSVSNSVPAGPSRPGTGMALANVRERLHLLHDVAARFDARRDGDSFQVHLVLPMPA